MLDTANLRRPARIPGSRFSLTSVQGIGFAVWFTVQTLGFGLELSSEGFAVQFRVWGLGLV